MTVDVFLQNGADHVRPADSPRLRLLIQPAKNRIRQPQTDLLFHSYTSPANNITRVAFMHVPTHEYESYHKRIPKSSINRSSRLSGDTTEKSGSVACGVSHR